MIKRRLVVLVRARLARRNAIRCWKSKRVEWLYHHSSVFRMYRVPFTLICLPLKLKISVIDHIWIDCWRERRRSLPLVLRLAGYLIRLTAAVFLKSLSKQSRVVFVPQLGQKWEKKESERTEDRRSLTTQFVVRCVFRSSKDDIGRWRRRKENDAQIHKWIRPSLAFFFLHLVNIDKSQLDRGAIPSLVRPYPQWIRSTNHDDQT